MPGSVRDAAYQGGRQSQISGYYDPVPTAESPTGWVYIVANNFDHTQPVTLYRAKPGTFTDPSSWQGWSACRDRTVDGQAADTVVATRSAR